MPDASLSELSVLGSLMISGSSGDLRTVSSILTAVQSGYFSDDQNRAYFEAARALYREGAPIDPVTVLSKLGLDGDADARQHAAEIMSATPTAANWREYADALRGHAVLSQLQASAIALSQCKSIDECREYVAAIESAYHTGHSLRSKTLEQLFGEFAERQNPDAPIKPRYPIGIPAIDKRAKLSAGKFVIIGGLPSDGKTALALQWAVNAATVGAVGVFSLETDDETVGDRIVTATTGIDYDHIIDQRLTDLDWVRFADQLPLYARRNLRVFDESRLTVEQIEAASTIFGLHVIFVDYGQLIVTDSERGATRAELLARVSIALKQYAREHDVLTVVLLQLKEPRRYKGADGKMHTEAPTMEDLGETRQWMKDADVIFTLSRPDKADKDNPYIEGLSYDKHRYLKIAKNKEGKRGTATLFFDGLHQRFYVNGEQPGARNPSDRKKQSAGNPGQMAIGQTPPDGFTEVEDEGGLPF